MNGLIPIETGQRWEHLVFGEIEILEVRKDCQGDPWYIARVENPRPEPQFGLAHYEGRTVTVMPRRMELQTGNRFMRLLGAQFPYPNL